MGTKTGSQNGNQPFDKKSNPMNMLFSQTVFWLPPLQQTPCSRNVYFSSLYVAEGSQLWKTFSQSWILCQLWCFWWNLKPHSSEKHATPVNSITSKNCSVWDSKFLASVGTCVQPLTNLERVFFSITCKAAANKKSSTQDGPSWNFVGWFASKALKICHSNFFSFWTSKNQKLFRLTVKRQKKHSLQPVCNVKLHWRNKTSTFELFKLQETQKQTFNLLHKLDEAAAFMPFATRRQESWSLNWLFPAIHVFHFWKQRDTGSLNFLTLLKSLLGTLNIFLDAPSCRYCLLLLIFALPEMSKRFTKNIPKSRQFLGSRLLLNTKNLKIVVQMRIFLI